MLATNAGANITITLRRGASPVEVTLRLVPEKSVFNAGMIRDRLGLTLKQTPDGFVITGVQPGSPADTAGLQPDMLVRAVDGQTQPADLTGLAKVLYVKRPGEAVRLDVAMRERVGNFNVLRQGSVGLVPR